MAMAMGSFGSGLFGQQIWVRIKLQLLKSSPNLGLVTFGKVRTIWEAHKNFPQSSSCFCFYGMKVAWYLLNVQSMRKIFSNFVCFSESPNFNCDWIMKNWNHLKISLVLNNTTTYFHWLSRIVGKKFLESSVI